MAIKTPGSITASDVVSVTTTGAQPFVTGTPTANSSVAVAQADRATVFVTLTGTWTGTVVFEKTPDGTRWIAVPLTLVGSALPPASSTTTTGSLEGVLGANIGFRVRATSAAFTGSVTVTIVTGDVATSGGAGLSVFKVLWPANTTPQAFPGNGAKAGQFYGHHLYNTAASVRFVRLFDKATAPIMGTDSPKIVLAIPPASVVSIGPAAGKAFALGMWASVTTGIADLDNTAPAANDVLANLYYA